MEVLLQQATDQSVDQRIPYSWAMCKITLIPVQYLDIVLVIRQNNIYSPAVAFDLPMQSVT